MKYLFGILVFVFSLSSLTANALEFFKGKATLEALGDYEKCHRLYQHPEICHDALEVWVKDHPKDTLAAAKLSRKNMQGWVAVAFFSKAFENGQGDCKDEDLKMAVLSGLDQNSEDGPTVNHSLNLGFKKCPKELTVSIAEAAAIGTNVFRNSCKQLLEKGLIQGLKKKKCEELKP